MSDKRHKVTEFRTVYIEDQNGDLVPYLVDPSGDLIAQDDIFNSQKINKPGQHQDMPSAHELEAAINEGLRTGQLNPARTGSDHLARFIEAVLQQRRAQKEKEQQMQQAAQKAVAQPKPKTGKDKKDAKQKLLDEMQKIMQDQAPYMPNDYQKAVLDQYADNFQQQYIDAQWPDDQQNKKDATYGDERKVLPHGVDPRDMPEINDPAFRARLSSIMNDNKFDRRLRGRTRGKLDMGRLYKAKTRARTIFTQKQSRKGKEYNIVIAVDESSSMSGRDINVAADICSFLSQTFYKLNLNLAVVGFNNGAHVHKKLDDVLKATELRDEIRSMCGGGTDSLQGLQKAYELLPPPATRKGQNIVLFITDGEITQQQEMKHLIAANEDRVKPVGIGISGANPGDVFPHKIKVNSIDDLKPKIIENIREQVRRG